MNRVVLIVAFAMVLVGTSGCVSGPVRHKTLGFRKSATVQMTSRARPILKPVAALAGVVVDVSVVVLDTVATPIASVPIAFELMGPDPQPTTRENVFVKIVTFPLWYPISYPVVSISMPFRDEDFYHEWFGSGSDRYETQPEEKSNKPDKANPR